MSLTSGKPYFTAWIELPHQGDWHATPVVCEGAPAVKLTRHGHSFQATFNKQDLINIAAGAEVTFTVTVFGKQQRGHDGYRYEHADDTLLLLRGATQ